MTDIQSRALAMSLDAARQDLCQADLAKTPEGASNMYLRGLLVLAINLAEIVLTKEAT